MYSKGICTVSDFVIHILTLRCLYIEKFLHGHIFHSFSFSYSGNKYSFKMNSPSPFMQVFLGPPTGRRGELVNEVSISKPLFQDLLVVDREAWNKMFGLGLIWEGVGYLGSVSTGHFQLGQRLLSLSSSFLQQPLLPVFTLVNLSFLSFLVFQILTRPFLSWYLWDLSFPPRFCHLPAL